MCTRPFLLLPSKGPGDEANHPPAPSSVVNTQVALLPPIQSQTNYTDPSTSDSISKTSASSKSPGSQQLHHVSSEASQASLEHLDDADSIEFEIREDEPVVKHTTRGKVSWTPIRVRNNLSTTGVQGEDYYDVEYLKKCKKVRILHNEETGWRASIHRGSILFVFNTDCSPHPLKNNKFRQYVASKIV